MIFTDIKNGNITVREIMKVPEGRELITREFPKAVRSPFFSLAQGMSLNTVLRRWGANVGEERIARITEQLKRI